MLGASSGSDVLFSFPILRAKFMMDCGEGSIFSFRAEIMHPSPSQARRSRSQSPIQISAPPAAAAPLCISARRTHLPAHPILPAHLANTALPWPCAFNFISPIPIPSCPSPAAMPPPLFLHVRPPKKIRTYLRSHHLKSNHIPDTQQHPRFAGS